MIGISVMLAREVGGGGGYIMVGISVMRERGAGPNL